MSALSTLWCIGLNVYGQFGIGNDDAQKQLMKCGWSEKIQIRNIYTSNRGYTVVEDMNGNYYSAGWNGDGACTVNDESWKILTMTPITYFKQHNIKIVQVFVSNMGDAPFWKAEDGSIYTSCNDNYGGRVGVEVDENKLINKIPFLSQLSINKMVSGSYCSIAICNDGSVYSTGTGYGEGENGLGAKGVDNESWKRIECLEDIIDCDFGYGFVIFLSSSGRVFSAGRNDHGQLGLNTKESSSEHIMRNPTEIEYFPDTSKYMKDIAEELKSVTHLPAAIVDVIIIHLPPVVPIVSIRCWDNGVVALDCNGNLYQWGKSLSGDSDILCPQEIKLEEKVVSIETGSN
eukprot:1074216_1